MYVNSNITIKKQKTMYNEEDFETFYEEFEKAVESVLERWMGMWEYDPDGIIEDLEYLADGNFSGNVTSIAVDLTTWCPDLFESTGMNESDILEDSKCVNIISRIASEYLEELDDSEDF